MTDDQILDLINEFNKSRRIGDLLWIGSFKELETYHFDRISPNVVEFLIEELWKKKTFNIIFKDRVDLYE